MDRRELRKAWAVGDVIVSPLGYDTAGNFRLVSQGYSGIRPVKIGQRDTVLAAAFDELPEAGDDITSFERICFQALSSLLKETDFDPSKTLLVLSTTKGNVDLIEKRFTDHPRLNLPATAAFIKSSFGFASQITVSNACTSGVAAIIAAARFIEQGRFDYAVVLGADILSEFVVSGFQSLLALSNGPCLPFDVSRSGINLGEGAAAILLTSRVEEFSEKEPVQITGMGTSNDANHISGPSRTGEELALAISRALKGANVTIDHIDFVSAHGTATLYNDEMEAKAFNLSGLGDVPLHSLKGYFGHTLGAAGVIETIIGMESLRRGELIQSLGYSSPGTSQSLNIITEKVLRPLNTFLKTSSGFGGCNAAIMLNKQSN